MKRPGKTARQRRLGPLLLAPLALGLGPLACTEDPPPSPAARLASGSGCALNTDCQDGLVCIFERCRARCDTSRDCGPDLRCVRGEPPLSVCQLPDEVQCTRTPQCPGSQICALDDRCRDECASARDCVAEQVCRGGTCANAGEASGGAPSNPPSSVATRTCIYTSDCAAGQTCQDGLCRAPCVVDAECGSGERCEAGRCRQVLATAPLCSLGSLAACQCEDGAAGVAHCDDPAVGRGPCSCAGGGGSGAGGSAGAGASSGNGGAGGDGAAGAAGEGGSGAAGAGGNPTTGGASGSAGSGGAAGSGVSAGSGGAPPSGGNGGGGAGGGGTAGSAGAPNGGAGGAAGSPGSAGTAGQSGSAGNGGTAGTSGSAGAGAAPVTCSTTPGWTALRYLDNDWINEHGTPRAMLTSSADAYLLVSSPDGKTSSFFRLDAALAPVLTPLPAALGTDVSIVHAAAVGDGDVVVSGYSRAGYYEPKKGSPLVPASVRGTALPFCAVGEENAGGSKESLARSFVARISLVDATLRWLTPLRGEALAPPDTTLVAACGVLPTSLVVDGEHALLHAVREYRELQGNSGGDRERTFVASLSLATGAIIGSPWALSEPLERARYEVHGTLLGSLALSRLADGALFVGGSFRTLLPLSAGATLFASSAALESAEQTPLQGFRLVQQGNTLRWTSTPAAELRTSDLLRDLPEAMLETSVYRGVAAGLPEQKARVSRSTLATGERTADDLLLSATSSGSLTLSAGFVPPRRALPVAAIGSVSAEGAEIAIHYGSELLGASGLYVTLLGGDFSTIRRHYVSQARALSSSRDAQGNIFILAEAAAEQPPCAGGTVAVRSETASPYALLRFAGAP